MRILCLSKNNDNILMWGHYAYNHKGFVIGFDRNYRFFKGAFKVYYSDSIPKLGDGILYDFLIQKNETLEELRKIFLTKSKLWEYENEYRCAFDVEKKYQYLSTMPNAEMLLTNFIEELKCNLTYRIRCN